MGKCKCTIATGPRAGKKCTNDARPNSIYCGVHKNCKTTRKASRKAIRKTSRKTSRKASRKTSRKTSRKASRKGLTRRQSVKTSAIKKFNTVPKGFEVLLDTGSSQLLRYPNFIKNPKSHESTLFQLPLVEKPEVKIYGKIKHQQRNVGFFAPPGVPGYRFSGQQTTVTDINGYPLLVDIIKDVNKVLHSKFNGILVNLYKDGTQYISAHSDDERDLAPEGVASIAFGAVRNFRIRDKKTKKILLNVPHEPGDLLVMAGDFQKEFTHEIPKEVKIKKPRISLTFRLHKKPTRRSTKKSSK